MSLMNNTRLAAFSLLTFVCLVAVSLSSISADAQNRRSFCNSYATEAVEQANLNEEQDCGFTGPRWGDNRTPHFGWCMIFPRQAEAEQEERNKLLRQCRQEKRRARRSERIGKRANCETYAKTAVVHAQANRKYECGFRGGEWAVRERPHFRWCMGARRKFLADETRYRIGELQKCFNKLGDYDEDQRDRGYRRRRL